MALLAGALAAVVAAIAVGAGGPATVDPDAPASVLYFQRLTAGRHLEAFVPTTPKPLLTILYGVAWSLAHDWRVLVWLTIAAQGAAVAIGGWLAWRLAGDLAAAGAVPRGRGGGTPGRRWAGIRPGAAAGLVAAGVLIGGLLASRDELLEVSRANSLVWVLGLWVAAGAALVVTPRRHGLAGVALLGAGLVRAETWLLIGPAMLWTGWLALRGGGRTPLRLWICLLAFPLSWAHDALLTGDPLFSLSVPVRYTPIYAPNVRPEDPAAFMGPVLQGYAGEPVLVALALGGIALLAWRRSWMAAALAVLAAGDLALLTLLAVRGTYVSARYFETIDLALLFAAAVGAGGLAGRLVERLPPASGGRARGGGPPSAVPRPSEVAAAVGGAALGVALLWPAGPIDRTTAGRLSRVRAASADAPAAIGTLASLVPTGLAWSGVQPGATGAPDADPAGAEVLVPSQLRSRVAVELGLPVTAVVDSLAAFLPAGPAPVLRPGQLVWHDAAADPPGAAYRPLYQPFEAGGTTTVGGVRVVPVAVQAGSWIVRVEAP